MDREVVAASSAARGAAAGAAGVAVVTVVRWLAGDAAGGAGAPWLLYVLAVLGAAWAGGFWPAAGTTLLAAVLGTALFTVPAGLFDADPQLELFRLAGLLAAGLLAGAMVESLRGRS